MAAEQDPVSWLLGNREIMVGVFMLIAWVVRMTGLSKEKQKSATQTKQSTSGDSEEFERTRRVQDEVRRKISERRSGNFNLPNSVPSEREPAPPLMAPRPIASSPAEIFGEFLQRRVAEPEPIQVEAQISDQELEASLERQKVLEEKMRQLSAAAREANLSVAERESNTQASEAFDIPNLSKSFSWISELRDPSTARRAMVLREVLSPPVALRH